MVLSVETAMVGEIQQMKCTILFLAPRERVQVYDLKQNVGMAASVAGAKTFGIKQNNFSSPKSDIPMDNPNAGSVTDPAHDIRTRNRAEESGNGGIHTTAGELAKEIAGLNKNVPLRPTDDFYRNQSFYYEGNLVQPEKKNEGIILPSGNVIQGDADYDPPTSDKDLWKGSVFERE